MTIVCRRPTGTVGTLIPIYDNSLRYSDTYDHIHWRTRDPVRSPLDKPVRAGSVVGSVTTSEYPVLYVPFFFFFFWMELPSFCPSILSRSRSVALLDCHSSLDQLSLSKR